MHCVTLITIEDEHVRGPITDYLKTADRFDVISVSKARHLQEAIQKFCCGLFGLKAM